MITLVPEDELPRNKDGKLMVAGFFCVKKNEVEDRLILDRRPENATMHKLDWASLPSGACFARLLLQDHEILRGSGDDLRNYYYALALPPNWARFNAVGRRVLPAVVAKWGGDPGRHCRAAMRVLGMGDTNACDIAQAVHEAVLKQSGLLSAETKWEYGQPLPHGDLFEGAYLDDLLIASRIRLPHPIPLDGSFTPPQPQATDPDMVQAQAAEEAYKRAGLERATRKSFRGETQFKAWGAEVDGVRGRVAAPLSSRRQVWVLLLEVIKYGRASKQILQRLLGYVCFFFQYRRELYALQHHVYKFLDSMVDEGVCNIPTYIQDELRSMCLHLPFSCWNMRRQFASRLFATDATPTSGGGCAASLPRGLAQKLWDHSDARGEAVRLDRDMSLASWLSAEQPKAPSQLASAAAEFLEWYVTSSYTFKRTSHINLQEMHALRKEVVALASDFANYGSVQLFLNDSRVVVGAASKGRSTVVLLSSMAFFEL